MLAGCEAVQCSTEVSVADIEQKGCEIAIFRHLDIAYLDPQSNFRDSLAAAANSTPERTNRGGKNPVEPTSAMWIFSHLCAALFPKT